MNTTLAPSLSAADRCDRCGAQAYIRARLVNGGELLFCAHHGREHLPRLQAQASEIHDESNRLGDKSDKSDKSDRAGEDVAR